MAKHLPKWKTLRRNELGGPEKIKWSVLDTLHFRCPENTHVNM